MIAIAHDLALASPRQIHAARQDVGRIVSPLAFGPARIIASAAVLIRLWRISRTATRLWRMVVAISIVSIVKPEVVVLIEIVGSVFARVVVAWVEIHRDLRAPSRSQPESSGIPCDRFVTDVRGFRWSAVAADRRKPQ
jgi:hypothetical protein